MEIKNDTKVSALIELIKEDRIEIRETKKILYSTIRWFVIASIAITAYGIDHKTGDSPTIGHIYLCVIDSIFILISWVFFSLTKRDLTSVRKSLDKRQNQLGEDFQYNYFQNSDDMVPDMKETDLYTVIGIATAIYVILIVFTIYIMK
jgi:predicted amino acid-binding ACT domain protein